MTIRDENAPISDKPFTKEMFDLIRNKLPSIMAEEIVNVQPISGDVVQEVLDNAMTEEELRAAGYEPVEKNGLSLTWIKK